MKDLDEYKVYETSNIPAIGNALIVTTLRLKKNFGIGFECYIFIGSNKPIFIDEIMSCDLGKDFELLTEYDVNLFREYIYNNVYEKLIGFLSETIGENVTNVLLKSNFSIEELDPEKAKAALTKLWVFGKYQDELTTISTASKSYPLKEVLLEIVRLPSIKSTSIKGKI